jgi:DNA ligase-1
MLLADLVAASAAVAATSKRTEKLATLAAFVRRLDGDEVAPAVTMLSGRLTQGRFGVGWATLGGAGAAGATQPSVTISELDATLDELAATTGSGSAGARNARLARLFQALTPDEADFVQRLLMGELRQGANESLVADAVAAAAGAPVGAVRRALMMTGDLGTTAALALADGGAGLAEVGLEVGRALQPMLASTAASVGEAMEGVAGGPVRVEWKLDGVRLQVHRAGDEVRVFTRNLNEVADRVPEVVAAARELPVRSVVLDSEALGLGEGELPQMFQETMRRFGRDDASSHPLVLRPWFFDILHLDGEDLLDLPLAERLDRLAPVAGARQVPGITTADAAEAERFATETVAAGHEGVMVKRLGSPYEAGRRGKAWRKVKPVLTLDLVVLAAEWGHGRRRGWLSNLHLGARDPEGGLVMVGKTFKGLTDETLAWQTEQFLAREERRSAHTVFVRPEMVVEIALDGVQVSPRYPGGVALRFARVRGYRPDKGPEDADTIDTVRSLLPGR